VGGGRFIASQIEGARFVELPGDDHLPWLGDVETLLEAVEAFVAGHVTAPIPSTSLATLLFTDIVGSTKAAADLGDRRWNSLLQTHYDVVTTQLRRFEGREITRTGDGILGVFDGPARAIRCAMAIRERLQALGLEIRAGIHTSEVQFENGDVSGLGVHIAARLMGLADPGQIVVSAVVRDLAFGSGLSFIDRGERVLKGVPGRWVTFSVEAASTPADSRV
jgi:class 3 adenylate cyclase